MNATRRLILTSDIALSGAARSSAAPLVPALRSANPVGSAPLRVGSTFAPWQRPIFVAGEEELNLMANKRTRKAKKKHRKRQEGKEISLRRA